MAYRLPHVFGNVISQAASLWWGPGYRVEVPRSEGGYPPEWLIEKFEESPPYPCASGSRSVCWNIPR